MSHTGFYNTCLKEGTGIKEIVNYTLNMVGGTSGGLIDSSSDDKSFHGNQEIVAEKYFLCARQLEADLGIGTYNWVNFTSCMNGWEGIAICTYYLPKEVPNAAKKCAANHSIDWDALDACANGAQGDALFKASEYYTDSEMRKFIASNYTGPGIPQYGTAGGAEWGIPIIRIAGEVHKNSAPPPPHHLSCPRSRMSPRCRLRAAPDAYDYLGKRICEAAGAAAPPGCGCKAL
jgi:hypothetical protein